MKIVHLSEPLEYDGLQLSSAFFDQHVPDEEHALVLFCGVADVPTEHMVDLEDADAGESIYSPLMVHVLIEHRGMSLRAAVLAQRLLVRLAAEWISCRAGVTLVVRGDDLFVGDGKLSVSVATRSSRGALIHLGLNVDTEGAPVRAAGLRDLRIIPEEFAKAIGREYARELESVAHAVDKVRPVA
jgi:hypothetical protein